MRETLQVVVSGWRTVMPYLEVQILLPQAAQVRRVRSALEHCAEPPLGGVQLLPQPPDGPSRAMQNLSGWSLSVAIQRYESCESDD
jgi:hypothetical protein